MKCAKCNREILSGEEITFDVFSNETFCAACVPPPEIEEEEDDDERR
jgi:hypothetical protein